MNRGERRECRLTLSDVERDVAVETVLVIGQHPSETAAHVVLRVLAYCLAYRERIEFGPGVSAGDEPDLLARDLTGKMNLWIACGDPAPERVRHAVQHNRDAEIHVVFSDAGRRREFLAQVAAWQRPPRGWEAVNVWLIDAALVAALAKKDAHRQVWIVTNVAQHLYVEADGEMVDGPVERQLGPVAPA